VTKLAERDDGPVVSDDKSLLDLERIVAWLAVSYWANERDRATIERSLEHSYVVGVHTPTGEQVALARATTDFASFAWIGDVVVHDDWRGKGIGTWLVQTLVDELRRRGVPRFVLGTRDAHGVYEKVGFAPLRVVDVWMEIDDRKNRPTPPGCDTASVRAHATAYIDAAGLIVLMIGTVLSQDTYRRLCRRPVGCGGRVARRLER
jgi:GNAT superfamily N-acetyltransferase